MGYILKNYDFFNNRHEQLSLCDSEVFVRKNFVSVVIDNFPKGNFFASWAQRLTSFLIDKKTYRYDRRLLIDSSELIDICRQSSVRNVFDVVDNFLRVYRDRYRQLVPLSINIVRY